MLALPVSTLGGSFYQDLGGFPLSYPLKVYHLTKVTSLSRGGIGQQPSVDSRILHDPPDVIPGIRRINCHPHRSTG